MRSRRLILALIGVALLLPAASAQAAVTVGHSGWNWGSPSPQGQTIRALEFEGARGYAAGAFGTVLVTSDSGVSWTGAATGTTQTLDHVSIVDTDSVVVSGGCLVRRSDDGGITFRRIPWTASDARCTSPVAATEFLANETGYLLLEDGSMLSTTDGGRTWARRTAIPGTAAVGGTFKATAIAFTTPADGVAVTSQGRVYRTTDGGVSWTLVRVIDGGLSDVYFFSPMLGFAVGDGPALRTFDGGASWLQSPLGNLKLAKIRCADAFRCLATTQAGQSLYRSADGGNTWTEVSPSSNKLFVVGFGSAGKAVAAGEGGTTVVSPDGGVTWAPVGDRLTQSFTRIRAVSPSLVVAVGPNGTIARSTDGGLTWAELSVSTSQDVIDASFASVFNGYAVDAAGTVLRTTNGGASWEILDTGFHATPQAVLALSADEVLLIGGRGILRSADGGRSFKRVRARIVAPTRLFNVDRAGGRVFAYGSKNIVASRDRGRTWEKVLRPRKALLSSLDFVSVRTGFVLGQDGQVFKTRNGGRRWSDLSGVGTEEAKGMSFGSAARGYLALSRFGDDSSGYLLRTTDGGRSWRPQLVSSDRPAADGLASAGANEAFLIAGGSQLLFTTSGGERGQRSKVTLHASRRTARRRAVIRLRGRAQGARAGARVLVSRRERGESGWVRREATVASGGSFSTRWRLSKTAAFVAQWAGDEDSAGDGSGAVVVRVKRR
jgi:photosystem II stability/assembly factor-like uncharacterized protein